VLKLIKNLNYIFNKFKNSEKEFWENIEEELILQNVSYDTANKIISEVKELTLKENVKDVEKIKKVLKERITAILNFKGSPSLSFPENPPAVFMIVGVNGVGKTSSIAKLANMLQKQGKKILIAAADTFRSAAIEQMQYFADKLNIDIVHHKQHSDPGAVVYDSLDRAIAKDIDVVLIDTAGRMQTSANLIDELKKMQRIIIKKINRPCDEILLAIDANTGQNAKSQAEIFGNQLGISGIILTKTDSTSKGGIILSINNDLNIAVKLITFGEKIEDISLFDPLKFAELLID